AARPVGGGWPMSPGRADRVYEVFQAALECDAAGRPALLDQLCGGDIVLRSEVERLLAEDEEAVRNRFLTPPDAEGPGRARGQPAIHRLAGLDVHIGCPHCHSPIELVGLPVGELICPSCGSTFRLELESTATLSLREGQRKIGRYELIGTVGV